MVVIPPAPSNISLTFSYAGFEQFYYPVVSFTGSDNAEYYEVGVEMENESFQITGNFDWVDIGLATELYFSRSSYNTPNIWKSICTCCKFSWC